MFSYNNIVLIIKITNISIMQHYNTYHKYISYNLQVTLPRLFGPL